MMPATADKPALIALIPAKAPHLGKQRLSAVPPAFRSAFATAFALDTITAVRGCEAIDRAWLVCPDSALATAAAKAGVPTIVDPIVPASDFNLMLRTVVDELGLSPTGTALVVPADLPAMTSEDLTVTIELWDRATPGFVADAPGTGTTLYVARSAEFDPHYGPGSKAAHLAAGAQELPVWLSSVTQDVDDIRDLDAAIGLGVGSHTRRVLARLGLT